MARGYLEAIAERMGGGMKASQVQHQDAEYVCVACILPSTERHCALGGERPAQRPAAG